MLEEEAAVCQVKAFHDQRVKDQEISAGKLDVDSAHLSTLEAEQLELNARRDALNEAVDQEILREHKKESEEAQARDLERAEDEKRAKVSWMIESI